MNDSPNPTRSFKRTSAAFLCAALVMFVAFGWFFLSTVQAQGPSEIRGQIFNGTADAPTSALANVPVTLFQITAAGPVTRTIPTAADGSFLFTNVITDANAYFTRTDYAGIRYYSDIMPAEIDAVSPVTVTVYETQTLPANFTLERIMDVQPRRFNALQLLQLINPTDRAFFVPLPVPDGAVDVQFEDIRQDTIVQRSEDGTILYPVLPTTNNILYGFILPFTPPDYRLTIPLTTNVGGFSMLVTQMSGISVSGNNLVQGEPFVSQSGQPYQTYTAPGQQAATQFTATISNLPGVDNSGTIQNVILVGGGLGALALLAYPIYQRRTTQQKSSAANERVEHLQAIARLDDAFEAGELDETTYHDQRAELKAELLNRDTHLNL